ncbi:MAG: nickel pincer cofactor biosynthesis protein LarC [Brevinematia bacterium]
MAFYEAKSMKILYYDCFAGISGDMNLSALVDLAGNEKELQDLISEIFNDNVLIEFQNVDKNGVSCKKLNIIEKKHAEKHLHLHEIKEIIESANISTYVKEKSLEILQKIAFAEAKIHNTSPDKIHFHEIGAVDTIIDIVGGIFALEKLKVDKVYSSTIETGYGFIEIAHGKFPIPAPATAEILKGFPIKQTIKGEATTPTGAAIITSIATGFGLPENFMIEKIGYGAGEREAEIPNCLRVFYGNISEKSTIEEDGLLIEVNLDDMTPERIDFIMEKLFMAGALDVFITPIIMKKSRPAFTLSVLCETGKEEALEKIIFEETTTFGLRKIPVRKNMLKRKTEVINTPLGKVRVKTGYFGGREIKRKLEYEDVKRIATEKNLTFEEALKIIQSHCI